MRLHARLPLAELASLLQRTLPEVLFEGVQEGVDVLVKQSRELHVSGWDTHTLAIHVPVCAVIKLPERSVPGLLSRIPGVRSDEFDLDLHVRLLVTFETLPEWNLRTHTRAHYEWERKPTVGIPFFDLDVSKIAEPMIHKQLQEICARIDTFLAHELGLDKILYQAWNTLAAPVRMADAEETWVCVRPSGQILATPVQAINDALVMMLEVSGTIYAGMGVPPEAPALEPPLPLMLQPKLPPAVPVRWHFRAHVAALAAIARQQEKPGYARWLERRWAIRALQWPLLAPVKSWLSSQSKPLLQEARLWVEEQIRELPLPPYLLLRVTLQEVPVAPLEVAGQEVRITGTATGSAEADLSL